MSEPGFVYLIAHPTIPNQTKVGISGDLASRIRGYLVSTPNRDFSYFRTWELDSIEEARALEKEVLLAGNEAGWKRQRGEWLNMTASIVDSLVEDFLE